MVYTKRSTPLKPRGIETVARGKATGQADWETLVTGVYGPLRDGEGRGKRPVVRRKLTPQQLSDAAYVALAVA